MRTIRLTWAWLAIAAIALAGCGDRTGAPPTGDFESAGYAGSGADRGAADGGAGSLDGEDEGGEREVEEADIYRFVGDRLYVLNQYRGLYVFDVTDPDDPVEIGRMPLVGYPVEMYVSGDRAYAIVSDYFSYWHDDTALEAGLVPVYGSRIVGIDLSEPSQPLPLGEVVLDGYVSDTRKVGDVIYAVANRYSWWSRPGVPESEYRDEVVITSIDLSDPTRMREVQQETLEGNGWYVHATPEAFIIAGSRYDGTGGGTEVLYVDITDPTGVMELRGDKRVDGYIQDDTALDVHEGQLRLLTRNGSTTELRIFDATEPDTLPLLGELDYYYEGGLFGTTFDGDRLYMVHYMTIDPLEVVDLSDPTAPFVAGILEMPGWVERIAALGDRLIGLGVDDTDGRRVSVSLFDVTDPASPTLLDRISTGDEWSWSTAAWERKAWNVDRDAGLVLFPFSGWSEDRRTQRHALGILEFTDATLTPRGEVEAPAPVERGALYEGRVYALSQAALQVVDIRDRSRPVAGATVELARNVWGYGRTERCGVELVQPGIYWGWGESQPSSLRTTPLHAPDGAEELGRIELPRTHRGLMVRGETAVAIRTESWCDRYGTEDGSGGCPETTRPGVTVVSTADPSAPEVVADFELPAPEPVPEYGGSDGWVWSWWHWQDRYGAPYGDWRGGSPALDLGDGRYALIRTRSIECRGLEACESVGVTPAPATDGRSDRYGSRYENALVVLDVRDPASPALHGPIDLGEGRVEQPFVRDGTIVYSHAVPSRVDAEGRSWVRYYMKRARVLADGTLRHWAPVNVPGVVVWLDPRQGRLLTIDRSWASEPTEWGGWTMESWLNALRLDGDRASRTDRLRLGQQLASVTVRGERAYVVRREPGEPLEDSGRSWRPDYSVLSTVDASDPSALRIVGETPLGDRWWSVAAATGETLALSGGYGGGLALFALDNPDHPTYRRFVRTQGWTVSFAQEGDVLYLSGGPYGIQRIDLGD